MIAKYSSQILKHLKMKGLTIYIHFITYVLHEHMLMYDVQWLVVILIPFPSYYIVFVILSRLTNSLSQP